VSVYSILAGVGCLALFAVAAWRLYTRRSRGGLGAGAAGAYYDMLSNDRRAAIEVIVEERAERQDPETKDGKPETGRSLKP
jgi:hypothetical protein